MKNKLKKIIEKLNMNKIPLTMTSILILGIALSFMIGFDDSYISNYISYFCTFLLSMIFNLFFTEITFSSKKNRIIGYILSIILAIILNQLTFSYSLLKPKCKINCLTDFSNYMHYVYFAYIIILLAVSVFVFIKKNKINFSKYMNTILSNIFIHFLIYLSLNIGLIFIFLVSDIVFTVSYEFINILYALSFNLYMFPSFIVSLINIDDTKINNIFNKICLWCILPVSLISILIIYSYIVKILATKVMPDNLIFMLVSCVFIIGVISYFVCKNNENKITKIYSSIFPYLIIAPIFLQIYSVSIRFRSYGLTPDRYITYMFIVFEIITVFLIIFKKGKKLENMLIALSIICLVTTMGPLNLFRISYINQAAILNKYYKSVGSDYSKAVSAYNYLIRTETGKKYISEEVKNSNITKEINDKSKNNYKSYFLHSEIENLVVKNYSLMTPVKISSCSSEVITDSCNSVKVVNSNTNKKLESIDISDYLTELIKNNYLTDDLFNEHSVYKLNDSSTLHLYYLYIRINEDTGEIINFNIKGYLLEK